MIDIKELSIGNWIQNPLGLKGKIQSIKFMLFTKKEREEEPCPDNYYYIRMTWTEDGESWQQFEEKDIMPIEITPEFLEKNGIVWDDDFKGYYYLGLPDFEMYVNNYEEGLWGIECYQGKDANSICSVRYIHQMQNFLTACGIKLDLKV